jgi:hypothetical protein
MMIRIVPILFLLTLSACIAPPTVSKKEVDISSSKSRNEIIDLKNKNPSDSTDLAKIDPSTLSEIEQLRSIAEIKSKQRLVKFTDSSWKDFPITLDLNVVPLRTFFELLKQLTKLNFV